MLRCMLTSMALWLPAMSVPAAECPLGQTVLSCEISGGRALLVCLEGTQLAYHFGPPGRPELSLATTVIRADYVPWHGIGRAIFESLAFTNGPWRYEPYFLIDRLAENPTLEAGVAVLRNGDDVTLVECVPGTVVEDFDAVRDSLEGLGLCWNRSIRAWASRCEE